MEENQISDVVVRHCVIHLCPSTREWSNNLKRYVSQEGKLLFRFPLDADTRSRWIIAVAKSVSADVLYNLYDGKDDNCFICEDHFDLSKCMLNFKEYIDSNGKPERIFFTMRCQPSKKLRKCPPIIGVSEYYNFLMEHDYSLIRYKYKLPKHRKKKDQSLKCFNNPGYLSPLDNSSGQKYFSNEVTVKTEPGFSTDGDNFECGEYYFSSNSFKKISNIPYSDTSETQSIDLEIIPCDFCPSQFCYKHDLLKHVQAEHLDIGPEEFHCNHCPSSFANEQDCADHVNISHGMISTSISNRVDAVVNETMSLKEIKLEKGNVTKLLETHRKRNMCPGESCSAMSNDELDRYFKDSSQSINTVSNAWNTEKIYIPSEYTNEEIVTQSVEKCGSHQASDGNNIFSSQFLNIERNNLQFFCIPSENPSAHTKNKNSKQVMEESGFKKKRRRRKRGEEQTVKFCYIPTCSNSTVNEPNKIFFPVPRKCKRWYRVANMEFSKEHRTVSYCCQDHFDLENDAIFKENVAVLKRNVLPHKNNIFYQIFLLDRKRKRKPSSKKGSISHLKTTDEKKDEAIASFSPESLLQEPNGQVKNNDSQIIKIENTDSQHNDSEKMDIDDKDSINKDSKYNKTYKIKNENKETKLKNKTRINAETQHLLKELKVKLEILDPKRYTLKNPCANKDKIFLSKEEYATDTHTTKAFDLQMFETHEKHFINILDGMARMRKKETSKRNSESEITFAKETNDIKTERRHSDTAKTNYDDFKAEDTKTIKSFDLQEFEKHEINYENILNHKEEDDVFDDNVLLKPFKVIKEEVIHDQTLCLECPNLIPDGQILCQRCKEQQLINAILVDSQEICTKEDPNNYDLRIKEELEEIQFEGEPNNHPDCSKISSDEVINERNDKESTELATSKRNAILIDTQEVSLNLIKEETNNKYDVKLKNKFEDIKLEGDFNIHPKRSKISSDEESNEQNDNESKEIANSKRQFIEGKEQSIINDILIHSQDVSPKSKNVELNNKYDFELKVEFEEIKFEVDSNTNIQHSKSSDAGTNEQNEKELKENTIHKCEHCQKQFKTSKTLKEHVEVKHCNIKIKYTCSICKNTFACQRYLNRHYKKHHNIIKIDKISHTNDKVDQCVCFICGLSFKGIDNLGQHIKNCHSDSVQCTLCNSELKSLSYLKTHLRRVHRVETRKTCENCGQICRNRRQLFIHIRNKHPEKLKKCPSCSKLFNTSKYLESHMRFCTRIPSPLANLDFEIKVEPDALPEESEEDWCIK